MVNKVILVGNLGRDPETKSLPSGQVTASFSIATSRKYKDRDGNRKEETEWHNVVAFGKLAEIVAQYLAKGKTVYIEGRLRTQSWEDKATGQKKYKTEVVADSMQMLGGKGEQRERSAAPTPADSDFPDDDIPF